MRPPLNVNYHRKCNISTYTVTMFPSNVRLPVKNMEIKSLVKLLGRHSMPIIIEKCNISTYTVSLFPAKVRLPVKNMEIKSS